MQHCERKRVTCTFGILLLAQTAVHAQRIYPCIPTEHMPVVYNHYNKIQPYVYYNDAVLYYCF
jgi:hypothetical protein